MAKGRIDVDDEPSELEIYDQAEVQSTLDACDATPSGKRDRLAILLMWAAGLKLSEVLDLPPTAYNAKAGTITVEGNRPRVVMVSKTHRKALEDALAAWKPHRSRVSTTITVKDEDDEEDEGYTPSWRRKPPTKRPSPLICNLQGEKLDPSYYRQVLPRMASRAGVQRRMHAQGLRATFAADMYRAGVPAELICRQLGHGKLAFTVDFLQRLCPDHAVVEHPYFDAPARAGSRGR